MRDLDRESLELTRELAGLEEAFLARANQRAEEGLPSVLQYSGKIKGAMQASDAMDVDQGESDGPKKKGETVGDAEEKPSVEGGNAVGSKVTAKLAIIEGDTHPASVDPEGGVLLEEITQLRAKISERSTEKMAIARNLCNVLSKVTRKLDTDLAFFETDLRSCGDFDHIAGALPGSEVAFRPILNGEDLLLGRVILYHADIGTYDIADVDDSQRYQVPENQVTVLDLIDSSRKLSKGETVYAVYPDTTAFYLATVSAAPRRGALGTEPVISVQFAGDDADLTGQVPHKTVPLKYVIRST